MEPMTFWLTMGLRRRKTLRRLIIFNVCRVANNERHGCSLMLVKRNLGQEDIPFLIQVEIKKGVLVR